MKAQQLTAKVRAALAERSLVGEVSLCERCGEQPAVQAHHRRPRAMGGSRDAATNTLANLLHLCSHSHELIEWRRSYALQMGWLVKQCHNPAEVPVLYRGEFSWLTADGEVRPCTGGDLIAAGLKLGYEVGA